MVALTILLKDCFDAAYNNQKASGDDHARPAHPAARRRGRSSAAPRAFPSFFLSPDLSPLSSLLALPGLRRFTSGGERAGQAMAGVRHHE